MKKTLLFFILLFLLNLTVFSQQNIFDACRQGNLNIVERLYNFDENSINIEEENGYSPLVLACYYGHSDIVEFLVNKVKSVNDKTSYGSPLMAATVKGYDDIVDILLAHNVNPDLTDDKGVTAAHYAVLFRNYSIVEKLVKVDADFTIKNNNNKSALDYAKSYNDEKLNELLNLQKI